MTAHEDITDALDKLAAHGTPRQIADYLFDEGHVGFRRVANACPVARYVRSVTGHCVDVGSSAWCGTLATSLDSPVPPDIGAFIVGFDHGAYPELDAETGVQR